MLLFVFFVQQLPLPFSSLPQQLLQSITLFLSFSLPPASLAGSSFLHLAYHSQASFLLFGAGTLQSSCDPIPVSTASAEAKVALFPQLAFSSTPQFTFSLRANHLTQI
jgi:hypothetical protein